MPANSPKSGALLKTWRQQGPSGFRAKAWLVVRRSIATMIALALVGLLAYFVIRPMLRPKSYFAFLSAHEVQPIGLPPLEYVFEDFAGFTNLEGSFSEVYSGDRRLFFGYLSSTEEVMSSLTSLQQKSSVASNGTLIFYLSSHGVVIDGAPCLICNNFNGDSQDSGALLPVESLLENIESLPGARKLLLLDAARCDYAPRVGFSNSGFAEALQQCVDSMVESGRIRNVWVLSAASPGERSHTSPALQQSVFAYVAAKGLAGAADRNRGDRNIRLDEFCDYVRHNVPLLVEATTGVREETQNPVLLGPGVDTATPPDGHLLYARASKKEEANLGAEINRAQNRRKKKGLVQQANDFISAELSNSGVAWLVPSSSFGTSKSKAGEGADGEADDSDTIAAESREAQTEAQLALLEEVWSLTAEVAEEDLHPAEYAPHLWREHLDGLLWLEQLQQSGELTDRSIDEVLKSNLTGLKLSLSKFPEPWNESDALRPNVIDRIRAARPKAIIQPHEAPSLALAERIVATYPGSVFPEAMQDYVDALDRYLRGDLDFESLQEVADSLETVREWIDAPGRLHDLKLLGMLRARPEPKLTPEQIRQAVEVRRLAEQAVTDPLWGRGWLSEEIDYADRWRLEAERLLVTQNAADWAGIAEARFDEAKRFYKTAINRLSDIREAERLHDTLMSRYRDYLRARRFAPGGNQPTQDFVELLGRLKSLREDLEQPSPETLTRVRAATSDLKSLRDKLEHELGWTLTEGTPIPADQVPRMDLMQLRAALASPYLTPRTRIAALGRVAEAEKSRIASVSFEVPENVDLHNSQGNDERQKALELDYASTLDPDGDASGPEDSLSGRFSAVDKKVATIFKTNRNLNDTTTRPERLRALRLAAQARVLSSDYGAAANKQEFSKVLHDSAWYDLLHKLRERTLWAKQDASPYELQVLNEEQSQWRTLLEAIETQPDLESAPSPLISLQAGDSSSPNVTSRIDLDGREESATINAIVRWRGAGETDVWLIAEYNQGLIEIIQSRDPVYRLPEVRRAERRDAFDGSALEYPYFPDLRKLEPSFTLGPDNRSRTVPITVRRLRASGGNTKLALKAAVPGDMIRQDLEVHMPENDGLLVTPSLWYDADCFTQDSVTKVYTVYLYPNRIQPLTLSVTNTNKDGPPLNLKATLFKTGSIPSSENVFISPGKVDPSDARVTIERFDAKPIAAGKLAAVRPRKTSPVIFDADSDDAGWDVGVLKESDAVKKGLDGEAIPNGLLLVLEDLDDGQQSLRYFEFEVTKPRQFVDANAEYDPGTRRLTVALSQKEGQPLPEGRVTARLNIDRRHMYGDEALLEDVLVSNSRTELFATVNIDSLNYAFLDIDDYPRAFAFRVVDSDRRVSWREVDDLYRIVIVSPTSDAKLRVAPNRRVGLPVSLRVDLPHSFSYDRRQRGEELLVGIVDRNDRDLSTGEPKRLYSDRKVGVYGLRPETSPATIALNVNLSDITLDLETGIKGPANVLSLARSGGDIVAREYHEIALDSRGPITKRVEATQRGDVLEIRAVAEDPGELSSVAVVQAAFAVPGAEKIEWEDGKPLPNDQWLIELKIPESEINKTSEVMVRAIDEVKNVGRSVLEPVRIGALVKAGDPTKNNQDMGTEEKKQVTNTVRGRLKYGRSSLKDIEVQLLGTEGALDATSVDDSTGVFVFKAVPPGEYVLEARAEAAGKPRSITTKPFKVSDRQGATKDLKTIKLPTN